jgi:type IV pilus assembly protein PilP
MMNSNWNIKSSYRVLLAAVILLLAACSNNDEMIELQNYVNSTVNRPPGQIEPIPAFRSYEPFQYGASSLRSPFVIPPDITQIIRSQNNNVRPNENRPRELLEDFPLSSLVMVGTISRANTSWVLILDETGLVSRATIGNYMGRNHGRIVQVNENQIDLVEIVPTGDGSWMERPQSVILRNE